MGNVLFGPDKDGLDLLSCWYIVGKSIMNEQNRQSVSNAQPGDDS